VNPASGEPFSSATRLTNRCKALGDRAGVKRCTPHCFRDTFACDMLAKGAGVFEVAKMLADTVETVEEHYAQFVNGCLTESLPFLTWPRPSGKPSSARAIG
jgi:integrase